MAKGRHLKPDFFTDKHIVTLDPLARLLYQGLWCYADDCGHLDDEPIELKMRILPMDVCDVEELLSTLAKAGRIERSDGIIFLPTLRNHARIDKRWESLCEPCKALRDHGVPTSSPRSAHAGATSRPLRDHSVDVIDVDVIDGDGGTRAQRKKPSRNLPSDWQPTEAHVARCAEAGIDLAREADAFRLHAEANDRRAVNWNAAFSQWLLKARPSQASIQQRRSLPNVNEIETPPDGLSEAEYSEWIHQQAKKRKEAG